MRDANPSRRSPAAASTSASCSPSSSLRSRVSRLPRIGVNRAPGNSRVSCAMRRTLPVPIDGDLAERGHELVDRVATVRPRLVCAVARTGSTTASRGSSRGSTPAIASPSGSTAGMSLLLCTARSISPRSSASSISLTNSRLPPTSDSGASCSRSPDVLMTTMRQGGPPAAAMRAATVFACHSASWLPRVPSRSSSSGLRARGQRSASRLAARERLDAALARRRRPVRVLAARSASPARLRPNSRVSASE